MAVIPYQPTYSVQPKYGFRYLSQPTIPNVKPVAPVPKVGLDGSKAAAPPVMGVQQGQSYLDDPFDDDQFGGVQDKTAVAQALGYERGTQNPANILKAVPGVGTVMNLTGYEFPEDTYGDLGTYDAQGNVFGDQGRAFDPVTGQAANSYGSFSDFKDSYSDSYSNLRESGEGVISSALGSYQNSVPYMQELNPGITKPQARAMRGMGTAAQAAGVDTTASLVRANTIGLAPGEAPTEITNTMLGFDDSRPAPPENTGVFGVGTGDLVPTAFGIGVRNESGTISTPTGTVVSVRDPATGENVSLLGNTAQAELKANQTLEAITDPLDDKNDGGMSGFSVSDGDGGSYMTDSSGGTNINAAGQYGTSPMGMEDEYDDDSDSGGGGK